MSVDVTVIIAAYNVESYIERAIRSALDQVSVTVEVMFIDDCSTDNTWAQSSQIFDPRLRRVRLTENVGPGAARNAGLNEATGKWIAILDGDDAFEPYHLSRCLKRADTLKAQVVVDNITVNRESDGSSFLMFNQETFSKDPMISLTQFIRGNQSFLGGYTLGYLKPVFSKEFLDDNELSYNSDLRIGEDYYLLAECLASRALCAIEPTAGYIYTARKGSISYRLTQSDVNRIHAEDLKFILSYNLSPEELAAQKQREKNLKLALAYTTLVDCIKKHDLLGAYAAFLSCPPALIELWRPLWVRIQKLLKPNTKTAIAGQFL